MKTKLMITLALSIFTLASNAQTEKGSFLIGGSIGYSTAKSKSGTSSDQRSTTYIISPKIGYFIGDNFAIGTKLQYSVNKFNFRNSIYENSVSGEWISNADRTDAYGISPFARYYVSLTDILKFYGEFEMSFETGKSKKKELNGNTLYTNYKFNNYRPALSPGLVLFPSKKWAIEFSFPLFSFEKRTFSEMKDQNKKGSTSSFNFGLNTFSPKLGFNYHF